MTVFRRYLLGFALLSAGMPQARACDFCLLHQGISPLETLNGAGVRLDQRYTLLDSVYRGTDEVDNPGAHEEYWTTDLGAFYSPLEGLLLLANLPIRVTQVDGHLHAHDDGDIELHDDTGGDEGLGDLSLLARYTFLRHHTLDASTLLAVSGGVKLPTGSTNGHTDDGEFLDAHTQLGTGSTDVLLGLSFNHSRARWSISGNALLSINGKGEAGDKDHEFGDSVNYDVTARYRLSPATLGASETAIFLSFGVAGELRAHEKEDGETAPDSGGHTIYVTPGVQVNMGPHWVAEVSYHHAVYHDLNLMQLGEDFKVFGSLTYLF
jgi:hypothetical protein